MNSVQYIREDCNFVKINKLIAFPLLLLLLLLLNLWVISQMIHKKEKEKGKWVCSPIPEFAKKQFGSWIQNIFIHLCWIIIATLLIYYYYYCVLYFRTLQCVCVCVCHGNALFTKQETAGKQFLLLLLPSTFYLLSREEGGVYLARHFFLVLSECVTDIFLIFSNSLCKFIFY